MRALLAFLILASSAAAQYGENGAFELHALSPAVPVPGYAPPCHPYKIEIPVGAPFLNMQTFSNLPLSFQSGFPFYYVFISRGAPMPWAVVGPNLDVFNINLSNYFSIAVPSIFTEYQIPMGANMVPGMQFTIQCVWYHELAPGNYGMTASYEVTVV